MSILGDKSIEKIKSTLPQEAKELAAEIRNKLSLAYAVNASITDIELANDLEDSLNEIISIANKLSR